MKNTIVNLIVVAAFSFSSAAIADTGMNDESQSVVAEVEQVAAASTEKSQPATKHTLSTMAGADRPKNLDLRHCLELEDNLAIARCAYE